VTVAISSMEIRIWPFLPKIGDHECPIIYILAGARIDTVEQTDDILST
jgi:hypothetical protein